MDDFKNKVMYYGLWNDLDTIIDLTNSDNIEEILDIYEEDGVDIEEGWWAIENEEGTTISVKFYEKKEDPYNDY